MKRFLAPGILTVAFAISRLLYETVSPGVGSISLRPPILERAGRAWAGLNFEVGTLERGMPLIDETLLRQDLARSLYYLHSQPPLFNLLVAAVLRSTDDFARTYQRLNWALGLALFLLTFALMRRLRVGEDAALVLGLLFLLNPNAMWMESAVYYGTLMALLLTAGGYSFLRALAAGSLAWFALACLSFGILTLTRAFFSWPWCVAATAFAAWAFARTTAPSPRRLRGVAAAALLPIACVAAFQVKQWALFGLLTGSSWFGCSLTTMTAGMRPEKEEALGRGKVSPLVNVYRNDTPEVYKRYVSVPATGIPILDQERKAGGEPNYHNLVYVPIGRQYLADSLYVIARAPHKYAVNVLNSVYVFSGYQIGMYWQDPRKFFALWSAPDILAPFVGFPLIAGGVVYGIRRTWRPADFDPARRLTVAFMTGSFVYVALVACLFEKSEGPLYRYQADAFLVTLLGLAWTEWRARRLKAAAGAA
jgi:hypothetical protein